MSFKESLMGMLEIEGQKKLKLDGKDETEEMTSIINLESLHPGILERFKRRIK